MSDVILPDGSVLSSSQIIHSEVLRDENIAGSMVGVVLDVHPSDTVQNLSASLCEDTRGYAHECRILIIDDNHQPNLILENVVIPPSHPAGIDNYEEQLPRGLAKDLVDGKKVPEHFKGIDFSDLDAEFCIVGFIGGNLGRAYVQKWWNHPINKYDPATSNASTAGKPTLKQVDLTKNRFRKLSRVNGVTYTVSTKGDVYVDTSEANRHVKVIDGLPQKSHYDQGGSIQVDIKTSQQLEFNFNEPVEGLAAGSNSSTQSRDPSRPHIKHVDSTPVARGTSRTFLRFKQYESLIKTSNFNLYCKTEGSEPGQATTLATDTVCLMQGEETVASITMQDGKIQLIAQDGSTISISNDQSIAIVSPNGASISIDSSGKIALQGGEVGISGNTSIGGGGGQPTLLSTSYLLAEKAFLTALTAYINGIKPVADPANAATPAILTAIGTFITASELTKTKSFTTT